MFRLFRPENSILKMLAALAFLSKVEAQHHDHHNQSNSINNNAAMIGMAVTIFTLSICTACCRIHCRGNQQNNNAQAEVAEQPVPDLEAQQQNISIATASFIGAGQDDHHSEAQEENNSTTRYTPF